MGLVLIIGIMLTRAYLCGLQGSFGSPPAFFLGSGRKPLIVGCPRISTSGFTVTRPDRHIEPPTPPVAEAAAANVDIRDSLKQWPSSAKTERHRGFAGDVSPFLPG